MPITKQKFKKLNLKQKIYKIITEIRLAENNLKQNNDPDLTNLYRYLDFLKEENEHKKLLELFKILKKHEIFHFEDIANKKQRIKCLNFAFHDLLKLIQTEISEKFFSVKIFDRPQRTIFDVVAILDDIRSPFNVGSIFRTADAFGLKSLALCGITPKADSLKVQRVSMGTEKWIENKYYSFTKQALLKYRKLGYKIYAVETIKNAISLSKLNDFQKPAFIFGNEEFGITDDTLALADEIIEIPVFGKKNSINVANAFAIVMYHVINSMQPT